MEESHKGTYLCLLAALASTALQLGEIRDKFSTYTLTHTIRVLSFIIPTFPDLFLLGVTWCFASAAIRDDNKWQFPKKQVQWSAQRVYKLIAYFLKFEITVITIGYSFLYFPMMAVRDYIVTHPDTDEKSIFVIYILVSTNIIWSVFANLSEPAVTRNASSWFFTPLSAALILFSLIFEPDMIIKCTLVIVGLSGIGARLTADRRAKELDEERFGESEKKNKTAPKKTFAEKLSSVAQFYRITIKSFGFLLLSTWVCLGIYAIYYALQRFKHNHDWSDFITSFVFFAGFGMISGGTPHLWKIIITAMTPRRRNKMPHGKGGIGLPDEGEDKVAPKEVLF